MKTVLGLKTIGLGLLLCVGTGGAPLAQAEDTAQRLENRQTRQEARITQGVLSGKITRSEARQLSTQQSKTRRVQQVIQADGTITPKEAAKMEALQDDNSREIQQQKRD